MQIIKIETAIPDDIFGGLVLVRIHTDEGIIGCGESYYCPEAVASIIHNWMSKRLIGADPLRVEDHWRFLYQRMINFGGKGAEMRALSAIDLALWDILGQSLNCPIWQLLGGKVQDKVPVYNSSGSPTYCMGKKESSPSWPGFGTTSGQKGKYEDNWASHNEPLEYVAELIEEGFKAVKVWPLDELAKQCAGTLRLKSNEVRKALDPLFKIRQKFGDKIDIMLDGHGHFQLPAAIQIAKVMEEIEPLWLEDVLRIDCLDTLKDFRDKVNVPISVSEMLTIPDDYRVVLEKRAADYIMIDPTWVGGISSSKRIIEMAQIYNIPASIHDCTGPLTLFSGLHLSTSSKNVAYQESVRAHVRLVYDKLIGTNVKIENGFAEPPSLPGIGTHLLEELFKEGKYQYQCTTI